MDSKLFDFPGMGVSEPDELLAQFFRLYQVTIDQQGIVVQASDEFILRSGYSGAKLIGKPFSMLLPADEKNFLKQVRGHSIPKAYQQTLLCADQSVRSVNLTLATLTMASEQFMVVTHCDWSVNKIESQLTLFKKSSFGEFLITPESFTIVAANDCAQTLCGLSQQVLSSQTFSDIINVSDWQLSTELSKLLNDRDRSCNLSVVTASGELQLVKLTAHRVEFAGEPFIHLQTIEISAHQVHLQKVQQATDLTDSLFDLLPTASLLMDNLGNIAKINQAMTSLLGRSSDDLLGLHVRSVLPPVLFAKISPMEASICRIQVELNQQALDVEFHQQPMRDRFSSSQGLLLTIAPQKIAQLPVRIKALETVNEMALLAIFTLNPQGEFIYINEAFEQQSRYKSVQLIGHHISLLNGSAKDPYIFNNMLDSLQIKNSWRGNLKFTYPYGSYYWADVSIKPVYNERGEIENFVGVSTDTTRQKELQQTGVFLANYDLDTGLANDILAKDRLEGMLARARRRKLTVAVIYLDITEIESLAFEVGTVKSSELLSAYCTMLRSALRSEDAVARMSQTRLAILLPDLPNTSALEVVAAKIDKVNQKNIVVAQDSFDIDIRLGIAYYPEQGSDADSLFLNAESSLQKAWHANESIGCFGEQQNEQAIKHFNLRRDIVKALASGKLKTLYQPILDLASNKVTEFEVMVCWQHPKHGLIEGEAIYAVAEAGGIMSELGLWLFEQACIDLKYWHAKGYSDISVALNLSHGQLRNRHIAQSFAEILQKHGIAAQQVSVELPISYMATQWLELEDILQEFSLMGLTLQYDKFGERGAYISDLSSFPFSGLKLSASYVSQLEDNQTTANLIQGIIRMAQALDMTVTAVGVDSLSEFVQLQNMGCHYIQGDFTCRFASREEMDVFLGQQSDYPLLSWE